MEDILEYKECIKALLRDVMALDDARDLLHAELRATLHLIGNSADMDRAANSALLALRSVYAQQAASIQDLDGRISELERQLALYAESFPDLVTQVTKELGAALEPELGAAPGLKLGAAPGLKLGAAPEPEDDPELVAALESSLESKQKEDEAYWAGFEVRACKQEEDEAYWAGFEVRAWQPAQAGAPAHVSRLVVEAEKRAAALNQQQRAGVRALMAADSAFGLPSGWPKGWNP